MLVSLLAATALIPASGMVNTPVLGPDNEVMYRTSAALVLVGKDFAGQTAFEESASTLENLLHSDWKFPKENIRVRPVSSSDQARRELSWLQTTTTEEDRVIVIFVSHGVAGSNGPEFDFNLGSGRYPMEEATTEFARIKARHKLLILDACRSGDVAISGIGGMETDPVVARERRSAAVLLTSDPGRDGRVESARTRFVEALRRETTRAATDAKTGAVWLSDVVPGKSLGFARLGSLVRAESSQMLLDPAPIDTSLNQAGDTFRQLEPEQEEKRREQVADLRRVLERGGHTDSARAILRLTLAKALTYEPRPTRRRDSLREAVEKLEDLSSLPGEYAISQSWTLAQALYILGELEGDSELLRRSVSEWQSPFDAYLREKDPMTWAKTQNNLGVALSALSRREPGTKRLEEAVAAYRLAQEVYTRADAPADWARIQNNMGNALWALGNRQPGTARLEEAIDDLRAALEVFTRQDAPADWARIQNNMGNALSALGKRQPGTARLEEAIAALRAALEVFTRADAPAYWAMTQNNLGNALQTLGEREPGTKRLEEAISVYRLALEVYTREDAPDDWASTQNNQGIALQILGEREPGTKRLEEAVSAYRLAQEVYSRADAPAGWAMTQNNLGNALSALGERERGTARLEEAVLAFRAAQEVYTRADAPADWAMTQTGLGVALQILGQRETGTARLEEATSAFRAALEVRTREDTPAQWAATQTILGGVYIMLSERADRQRNLLKALEHFRLAEQGFRQVRDQANADQMKEFIGIIEKELKDKKTASWSACMMKPCHWAEIRLGEM
jgi:tetratricopeptide (TPR) repeat protein